MSKNTLYNADILSADQFNIVNLQLIMDTAKQMEKIVNNKGKTDLLTGKIMTTLFYEPSSRTFASFIAAMQRLGGGFIPLQGVTHSSVAKGESLPDTVRTFANYSDVIVIRHPEVGSVQVAADFADIPVINAGDGIGEHPTQGLLDLFTIHKHFSKLLKLTVTVVGDLLNGRTIHSLVRLLSLYPQITMNLVSPQILKLPPQLKKLLLSRGVKIYEMERLNKILPYTDVLYITRIQKERFTDLSVYEKLKYFYIITPKTLNFLKKTAIVMHPLPRVGEIDMEVDLDKRAVYIKQQMQNGMYIRMALLALILLK